MFELEDLIAEIKANRQFDDLEMEFVHTRAKGILQLLQLLDKRDEAAHTELQPTASAEKKEPEKQVETEVSEIEISETKAETEKEITEQIQVSKPMQPESAQQETEIETTVQKEEKKEQKPETPEIAVPEEAKISARTNDIEDDDDDVLEDDIEKKEVISRLGDSFLKGKSLNDIIPDHANLEFKLSNRPVSSIQSAIGINDRFQYIRELFDGDSQKFQEAVKTLDSRQNGKEAVEYLRTNFKWKKNETSLKFVNLVKRRFSND
ncbi:hypothetical protein SAMN05444274_102173 [Mariniphaga anaerophila]|uniref:Uncharacterized protein n=2 Tax=Mariniphaga anaerophila TaxID=1484053 RepID=A0A1M4VQ26_9BACT|nr:hypothetical protein SAMN05444274_102173 [Mariniphaga anaerophila]